MLLYYQRFYNQYYYEEIGLVAYKQAFYIKKLRNVTGYDEKDENDAFILL